MSLIDSQIDIKMMDINNISDLLNNNSEFMDSDVELGKFKNKGGIIRSGKQYYAEGFSRLRELLKEVSFLYYEKEKEENKPNQINLF